ncbi:hypothetical protein F2Q70_00031091 [Brassica cretica]|uniref:Uncharacterized protein n=1 Tax=Brassica cretica TaxID=69181 RepID=A0A8S9FKC1_BRACR|nr:hypothetical protein F2Q70_00031091 [Brassica cretica]
MIKLQRVDIETCLEHVLILVRTKSDLQNEEYMIPIQLLDDIMAKKDEQHVSGELSRVEEAGTEDTTSTLTDGRTSTSNDGRTSTSTDGTTSTSTDDTTSISTDGTNDGTTSTSIDGTTSMSIDSTTSTSTNGTTSTLIDDIVDRHPSLEELPRYIVELEPVEEIVHNADSKHLRQLICAEEAVGFQKRVKRIHDTVKIVIPCAVVEVEFPIPPDRCMQLSPYIGVLDDPLHAEASQRGL